MSQDSGALPPQREAQVHSQTSCTGPADALYGVLSEELWKEVEVITYPFLMARAFQGEMTVSGLVAQEHPH